MKRELLTAGYQGQTIDSFVESLKNSGVDVLIDVRLNPISRKPGFSKTKLRLALAERQIDYVHLRALGNPSEHRRQAKTPTECLSMYEEYMADRWDDALPPLLQEATGRTACLMCFERSPSECHRSTIAREVQARVSGLGVRNLQP